MPIYWINTKDKGLSSSQITEAERVADGADFSIASYDFSHRAIHVTVLDGHSEDDLPALPYGLAYSDSLNS